MLVMAKKQRNRRLQAGGQPPAEVPEAAREGRSLSTMARICILVNTLSPSIFRILASMYYLYPECLILFRMQPEDRVQGHVTHSDACMQLCIGIALQALGALLLLGFLMSALGQSIPFLSDLSQSEAPASTSPTSGPQLYSYDIIETYPHDPNAFTQGLDYDKVDGADVFWESTGARRLKYSILSRIPCGMALSAPQDELLLC